MDHLQTTSKPTCTARSGASQGIVNPETGVSTCPMCSRECKGDRGLQVHLRTCRKRSGSSVSADAGTTSLTEAVVCLPQPSSSSSEVVVCLPRPSSNVTAGKLTASQDVAALLPQTASSSGAVSVLPQTTSSASESNAQLGVAALPQPAGLPEAVVCLPRLTGYVQSSTGPSDVASANPCTVCTDSTRVRTPGQASGIPRTSTGGTSSGRCRHERTSDLPTAREVTLTDRCPPDARPRSSDPGNSGTTWIGNARVTKSHTCSSCDSSFVSTRGLSMHE